ncbi:WbqC family protein [Paraburkholderia denitrificans]|uniref:WbqC family protein n=1 Tax=Paraburkholderia denitrificans TaxID=694025 RepID=A0ABW0JAU2_9BURK
MKKVAILQSNYIPWKGYFDLIAAVDEFVIYDEVQFTKNDWRNRNRIKTRNGSEWITIPVQQERLDQKISETRVLNERWAVKHWKAIANNYARAPYFAHYAGAVEALYRQAGQLEWLSEINLLFIRKLCDLLGVTTNITSSRDYDLSGDRVARLVSVCCQAGANIYLSGPAAKSYLDERLFAAAGVGVEWMSYDGYPEYEQLHAPFEHGVTVLDLLFNAGPQCKTYMKQA